MTLPLSWKPVRRGAIYCAPGCGRGCKYSEYVGAKIAAKAICSALGKGWKPVLWENLGWHFKAVSPAGLVEVYGRRRADESYWATSRSDSVPQICGNWSTPRAAVNGILKEAKKRIAAYNRFMEMLP